MQSMLKDIDFWYLLVYLAGEKMLEALALQGFQAFLGIDRNFAHDCNKA